MLSPKRLVEKARKGIFHSIRPDSHFVADKGYFILYTEDGVRFMVPLVLLGNLIFQELLKMSEDEFRLPGEQPITLLCNAAFMEYILSLSKRRMAKDVEGALLASLGSNKCSSSLLRNSRFDHQQFVIS